MPNLLDANGNPVEGNDPQPQPEYVKTEDFKSTLSGLNETMNRLQGAVEVIAAQRNQPTPAPAAPAEPEITEADINAALQDEDGNAGAKIKAMIDRQVRQAANEAQAAIEEMRKTGLSAITEVVGTQAAALPYFKKYEKEIKAEINTLPDHLQSRAESWKYAHDIVVGRHSNELREEWVEEALRQSRENIGQPGGPGSAQPEPEKLDDGSPVPTPQDLGSLDAGTALRNKGVSMEQEAQKQGYGSWREMVNTMNQYKDPYEKGDPHLSGKKTTMDGKEIGRNA